MPILEMTLIEGYEPEVKQRLARQLTDAIRMVIPAPIDGTIVCFNEVAASSYWRGGVSRQGSAPLPDPVALVQQYLQAMEARDLPAARALLAPDFKMQFPGGVSPPSLEALVEWAKTRYRFVRKTYEAWDCTQSGDDTVVVCHGTLSGEWLDGSAFDGIRFLDRFVLRKGLIVDQKVWNDLALATGAR